MTEIHPEERRHSFAPAPAIASQDEAIGIQVDVHDREQLEIRLSYDLAETTAQQIFEVESYFFVPRNVGLNAGNYPRDEFYGDVTALMRLDAEPLPLDELADLASTRSPLKLAVAAVEEFQTSGRIPPTDTLAIHVKLFAYLHTTVVRGETLSLIRRLETVKHGPGGEIGRAKYLRALDQTLGRIRASLASYRRVRASFWPFERLCNKSFIEALRSGDEYMSLFLEERLGALTAEIDADPGRLDGSAFVARAKAAIATLAREEFEHRRRYGYLTLTTQFGDGNEYFSYRTSLLKKLIHQALYLDARMLRHVDTFVRNAVASVGAAIAATWALATQLPAQVAGMTADAKLGFFAIAVVAYVMKDRIKAATNEILIPKIRKFDHVSSIYGPSLKAIGLDMLDAKLREKMRFIPFGEVPEAIRVIRLERRTVRQVEVAANEEVIHYRKLLTVEPNDDDRKIPEGYGMLDIMRLSVRHFLSRLDEPSENIRFYDMAQDSFAEAKIPKVYHLNLVLHARQANEEDQEGSERYEHLRVVLNKEGIIRVERVGASAR